MKSKTSAALAALIAATIGFSALPPAVSAQEQGVPEVQDQRHPGGGKGFMGHDRGRMMMQNLGHEGMRGGLLDLVCSDQGAERLEIAFVRLSHRVELTAEQTSLFDELRTTALAAQTAFADTCAKTLPETLAETDTVERPDLVEGLKTRLALETARIEAMEAVLPKLEAFFNSLTDAQKGALVPQRGHRGDMAPGRHHRPGAPAAEQAPQAPTEG